MEGSLIESGTACSTICQEGASCRCRSRLLDADNNGQSEPGVMFQSVFSDGSEHAFHGLQIWVLYGFILFLLMEFISWLMARGP